MVKLPLEESMGEEINDVVDKSLISNLEGLKRCSMTRRVRN